MKKNIVLIIALLLISTTFISTVNAKAVEENNKKDWFNDLQNLKDAMIDTFKQLMVYANNHNVTEPQQLWNPSDMFESTRGLMELALVLFGHNPIGLFMGALIILIVCWIPFRLISLSESHLEFIENLEYDLTIWCEQLIHDLGIFGFLICLCIALPLAFPFYAVVMMINSRWYTIEAVVWCIQDAVQYCS